MQLISFSMAEHIMCRPKILAHTEQGHVVSCQACGTYELTFGTSLVRFEPADYQRFCKQIATLVIAKRLSNEEDNSRQICLDIYCSKARMVLSERELFFLHALLHEAGSARQIGFLLNKSYIKSPEH